MLTNQLVEQFNITFPSPSPSLFIILASHCFLLIMCISQDSVRKTEAAALYIPGTNGLL